MNVLKEFDEALACQETKSGTVKRGYEVEGNPTPYTAYLHKDSWNVLKNAMSKDHKDQYGAGGGKELEEKDGKPPKMASFASSSRMIYNLSRKIPGFIFEKKLTTTVGGMANLDGYLSLPDKQIFVEAKCREPYGHKAEQTIKQNYRDVYMYLREKMPTNFSCTMEDIPEKEGTAPKKNMRVAFFCKGTSIAYFDIKQMICHLLAVATERLKHPDDRDILFLYLLYNPTGLQLPQMEQQEVLRIYIETCWATDHYDFKAMFGHIIDFLIHEKGLSATVETVVQLKSAFSFRLCDQTNYKNYLK